MSSVRFVEPMFVLMVSDVAGVVGSVDEGVVDEGVVADADDPDVA